MKDFIVSVAVCTTASVAAAYIIREIQTDFWRSQKLYSDVKQSVKNKFKTANV